MAEIPIIIFHIGNQEYVRLCLQQALKHNKRVILISDNTNNFKDLNIEHYNLNDYKENADRFKSLYKHFSTNSQFLELICIQRWMFIESLMKQLGIQRAFICDSDVLIYDNIEALDKKYYKKWDVGLCTSSSKNVTGGQSFWDYDKLKEFVDYCFHFYQTQIPAIEEWKQGYKDHGGICDMTLLYYFVHGKKDFVGLRLPDYPYYEKDITKVMDNKVTFDLHLRTQGNHTSPNCYEMENCMKKIKMIDGKPYCYHKELGKDIRFALLHFQSTSKPLLKKFYLYKNNTLILQNAKSSYSVEERMKGFENLQDFIETKIQRKEKFFIGRLSGNETRFCGQALCGKKIKPMLQIMAQTPGIRITSQEAARNYVQCYVNAVRNCNMLGVWDALMFSQAIDFYNFSKKIIPQKPIFHSCALEPFYFFCPSKYNNGVDYRLMKIWNGKRILVISSHINTIKQQIKNVDKIFEPYKIFNNNTFTFVCPPKTMAFNHGNKEWVEHFEDFKKRVKVEDFDIALVSCGGYGMPICDYIYSSMNKSCMYLGGPLQLLFGVMGKRWLNHETLKEYYNEFWTRPLDEDRPTNHHLCEHGHYW